MKKSKPWILASAFGLIGVLISGAIFFSIAYATGTIFGLVAILCGFISGGAAGLGYKIGKGTLHKGKEVKPFLAMVTLFGLLGIIVGYLAPYIYFAVSFGAFISLETYFKIICFNFIDALFVFI